MKRITTLSFFLVAFLFFSTAVSAQYYEVLYGGGRADGTIQALDGEHYHFIADPTVIQPYAFWMLVQSGGSNVIINDGTSSATDGLYLTAGDLLIFETSPPFDLYVQGNLLKISYGGAFLAPPAAPVCATGASGPVLLMVTGRYDVAMQTSTSNVAVQVATYGSVVSKRSGTLSYEYASGYSLQGTFPVPPCSGAACCHPAQVIFPVNKAGTSPFTVYTMTSNPASNFDYTLAVPTALQAAAAALPTGGPAPLAVAFTGNATGGTPPYTWDWDFGDGSAHKTVQNPSHTYAVGTFHPVLTVKDSAGVTSKDTHLAIAATSTYTVSADASPVQGQAPLAVSFTGRVEGGTAPYSYEWNFGDGSAVSKDQNPAHTYTSVGNYHVTLTAKDSAGTSGLDSHLLIKALGPGMLGAAAHADVTFGLIPLAVGFAGSASGGTPPYTYEWDFGDGSAGSTDQNPRHTYSQQGSFPVTLVVKDSAGQSATDDHLRIYATSSFMVVASAAPTGGPAPLIVKFGATLAGGTPPIAYAWDFGDGGTSSDAAPTHTYASDGTYPVTLTVQDSTGQIAVDNKLSIVVGGGAAGPLITSVAKVTNPFRLTVKGSNFQPGCSVYINDMPAPVTAYKSATQVMAKSGSALKAMVPAGVPVCVQVKNTDGHVSACFTYTR